MGVLDAQESGTTATRIGMLALGQEVESQAFPARDDGHNAAPQSLRDWRGRGRLSGQPLSSFEADVVTPPTDEPLPKCIGRYRVLGRLGAGGMGIVYKAHDPQLDRVVALKVQRSERTCHGLRFQREARAAARIAHPHVCPIYDVGEQDGRPFVVMAYVEGTSLEQRLASVGRFADVGEAIALILQVLEGLHAVHACKIVHRDLKPSNIMLDPGGRAVLVDFGLARPDAAAAALTSEGIVVGTPHYMAPEQAAGRSAEIGPWTDVFAAGVILYRLLTGRLPFEGEPLAVLARIATEIPRPPSVWRPDLKAWLDRLVMRSLEREPKKRYRTAAAFAEALRRRPDEPNDPLPATVSAAPPTAATAPVPSPSRRRSRWPLWRSFLAVGVGATAVLPGFWWGLGHYAHTSGPDSFGANLCGLLHIVTLSVAMSFYGFAIYVRCYCTRRGLLSAAPLANTDRLQQILHAGVAVDCIDAVGETPLMKATQAGLAANVKLLLLHGADPHRANAFGQTAQTIAAGLGRRDLVALLDRAESRNRHQA